MANKEELEFFLKKRKLEDIQKEFGNLEGVNIFSSLLQEGFIEEKEKGIYQLSSMGKTALKKLETKEKDEKNYKTKEGRNKYVMQIAIALLLILVTALVTHYFSVKEYKLQNELNLKLEGDSEYTLLPNQTYNFNKIIIHNPTSKKVAIKSVMLNYDNNWLKYQYVEEKEIPNNSEIIEIEYDELELMEDYEPYMELEAGETSMIDGRFILKTPYKEGEYLLNFYMETMEGDIFYIDRKLTINIQEGLN